MSTTGFDQQKNFKKPTDADLSEVSAAQEEAWLQGLPRAPQKKPDAPEGRGLIESVDHDALLIYGNNQPGDRVQKISDREYEMVVTSGNRTGHASILVPDGYDAGKKYPVVVGLHNFNGNRDDFAALIGAQRLRDRGYIVVLPNAKDKEWMGKGITITTNQKGDNGGKIDDAGFVLKTIDLTNKTFSTDRANLSVMAFSQGVSVGYEVARRLDAAHPGSVTEVVMAAGTNAFPDSLPGTNITQYIPGKNTVGSMEQLIKLSTLESSMSKVMDLKGCVEDPSRRVSDGNVLKREYLCKDQTRLTRIWESAGEHAWPGQPQSMDDWMFGRGSTSGVRLTDVFLQHQTRDGKLQVQRQPQGPIPETVIRSSSADLLKSFLPEPKPKPKKDGS